MHAQNFLQLDGRLKIAQIGQGQRGIVPMHDLLGIAEHIGQQGGDMRMRIHQITDTFNQCRKFFHDDSG